MQQTAAKQTKGLKEAKKVSRDAEKASHAALSEVKDLMGGHSSLDRAHHYVQMIMDPRNSKPIPSPSPLTSPYVGEIVTKKLKATVEITTNSAGEGYFSFAPVAGPVSDRLIAMYSTSAWAGSQSAQLTALNTAGATQIALYLANAPFTSASLDLGDVISRPEALAAYISPTSVLTSRGGDVWFRDTAMTLGGTATIADVIADPRTRRSPMVDSSGSNAVICYLRPRGSISQTSTYAKVGGYHWDRWGDNAGSAVTDFSSVSADGLIFISGPANAKYRVDLYYVVSYFGRKANVSKACPADPIAFCAATNALSRSGQDGYYGPPSLVPHVAAGAIHEHGGSVVESLLHIGKSVAKRFVPKLEEGAKSILREVGGFL